jgi:hypothetical protein
VTYERLKELCIYDPITGILYRRNTGLPAGYKNNKGYIQVCIDGKVYSLHRIAWLYMNGEFPSGQIDHINRIKSDNRWTNLREANNAQNQANTPIQRNNTSGVKGVVWSSLHKKWRLRLGKNGKKKSFGLYDNIGDVAIAMKKYHCILWGEFSYTGNHTEKVSS